MQLENVINRLIKFINTRLEALSVTSVTSGGIDSMENYKYIIGQINALEATKQELSNLLEDKEQNEKGTVINIKLPNNKLVGVKSFQNKKNQNYQNQQVGDF